MANLLDPLSKVSVTSRSDQSTEYASKRPRLEKFPDTSANGPIAMPQNTSLVDNVVSIAHSSASTRTP
ncbi:unnamed protein product [Echinostoma caproni]|uniref:Uncharacterized protein n=1 Tax=Echinostoma caproni TaxID=27848 RepID=A0A183AG72_9TREM|nr:unnamed protein product [Echinostoma caproni]